VYKRQSLYSRNGNLVASYRKPEVEPIRVEGAISGEGQGKLSSGEPLSRGYRFVGGRLHVWKPVTLKGKFLGTVYLEVALRRLRADLFEIMKITLLVMFVALFLTYPLSLLFQKSITQPILQLAGTMKTITQDRDYSLRVEKQRNDELGDLMDGFNDMVAKIQRRDEELERHRHQLEEEVAKRTLELSSTNQELEQTLEELKESEQHLTVLMESLGAGVIVVDAFTHSIIYANHYVGELLGVPLDRLKGLSCRQYFCTLETGPCPSHVRRMALIRWKTGCSPRMARISPFLKTWCPSGGKARSTSLRPSLTSRNSSRPNRP